jgi:hypothetical protein
MRSRPLQKKRMNSTAIPDWREERMSSIVASCCGPQLGSFPLPLLVDALCVPVMSSRGSFQPK